MRNTASVIVEGVISVNGADYWGDAEAIPFIGYQNFPFYIGALLSQPLTNGVAKINAQSQRIAKQIATDNNCTSQANAAMNAGPSVAPTAQNVIDGVVAATFTIVTDGAATALSVLLISSKRVPSGVQGTLLRMA